MFICLILTNYLEGNKALQYFKKERPTTSVNTSFLNFKVYQLCSKAWWHYETKESISTVKVNREKLRFLRHIIKKLN